MNEREERVLVLLSFLFPVADMPFVSSPVVIGSQKEEKRKRMCSFFCLPPPIILRPVPFFSTFDFLIPLGLPLFSLHTAIRQRVCVKEVSPKKKEELDFPPQFFFLLPHPLSIFFLPRCRRLVRRFDFRLVCIPACKVNGRDIDEEYFPSLRGAVASHFSSPKNPPFPRLQARHTVSSGSMVLWR